MATLTYCTNVHPGATLAEVERSLDTWTVPVARAIAGDAASFPVGLFVSAATAAELSDPSRLARFAEFLGERRLAIATFNCFPYGGFHAERVKLAVYRPSWLDEERVTFTLQAARVAAKLAPAGLVVPISTLAGSCKEFGSGGAIDAAIARNLARVAAELANLRAETGREIVLCLEPEPFTTLETSAEAVAFFREHVHSRATRAAFVAAGGASIDADDALTRHVGVCFDACHQAVEFEESAAAIDRLIAGGVRIGKLQLSNALAIRPEIDRAATLDELSAFVEPRWLHQALLRAPDGGIDRHLDLAAGMAALLSAPPGTEMRIHYHVPIDRSELGVLATTRRELGQVVAAALATRATECLEVETYTFPSLPKVAEQRTLVDALIGELRFARRLIDGSELISTHRDSN